jgi:fructose-1-phosphate kinase PfkB-like protein
VRAAEWRRFGDRFAVLAAGTSVVVLSGGLPADVPDGAYATLTGLSPSAGDVDPDKADKLASALKVRKIRKFGTRP